MNRKGLFVIFLFLWSAPVPADALQTAFFEKLVPLHEIKKSPGPSDWLATHPESGQTFAQYEASRPAVPDEKRKFIYVVLLGDFDKTRREIIEMTARYVEIYFHVPVKFAPELPLSLIPGDARRVHPTTGDRQILTRAVIEQILKPRMPEDAFCLIAFTSSDLWPGEGWNFVFGEASMEDRLGVWSIYRNGDPGKSRDDFQLCLKRTIKTGTHEIGHMFGLDHCIYYECNMNGSNHRQEYDARPLWLCPVCLRKIVGALNLDPVTWYQHLAQIRGEYEFEAERQFFERCLSILRQ